MNYDIKEYYYIYYNIYNKMSSQSSTFIANLVAEKFSVFNVSGKTKQPVTKNGLGLLNWQNLTFDEFKKEHNYNSNLWGMKMGLHENGRHILSLDFDIYDKPSDSSHIETEKLWNEYYSHCENEDGMYSSSTSTNMNVLVDYTNSPTLIEYVTRLPKYFDTEHLQMLLQSNQVIPPSQTICKKTGKLGNARTFKNDNPFYIIQEDENCFTFQFIQKLMKNKIKVSPQPIKQIKKQEPMTDNESSDEEVEQIVDTDDKFLDLLFNVIENKCDARGNKIISWDTWFHISGMLKNNHYDYSVFKRYSDLMDTNAESQQIWNRKPQQMSIYGLQNIAKSVNPQGYK
jgi:hypothetical protein